MRERERERHIHDTSLVAALKRRIEIQKNRQSRRRRAVPNYRRKDTEFKLHVRRRRSHSEEKFYTHGYTKVTCSEERDASTCPEPTFESTELIAWG